MAIPMACLRLNVRRFEIAPQIEPPTFVVVSLHVEPRTSSIISTVRGPAAPSSVKKKSIKVTHIKETETEEETSADGLTTTKKVRKFSSTETVTTTQNVIERLHGLQIDSDIPERVESDIGGDDLSYVSSRRGSIDVPIRQGSLDIPVRGESPDVPVHEESPATPAPGSQTVPAPQEFPAAPAPGEPRAVPAHPEIPVLMEKVYRYPSPTELVRPPGPGPFYPVTRAQEKYVKKLVNGVPYAIQEARDSWEEAVAVYKAAYDEGTIEVIPLPGTEFENAPYDMKPIKVVLDYDPSTTRRYRIPDATSFTKPRYWSKIYVVFVGEEVGLFWTWHQVMMRTIFLKEFRYEVYNSNYRLAITQYAIEQNQNTLKVTPRPGGVFDLPVDDSDDD